MPPKVPSFGEKDYWNARFSANSSPFEWLEAPTALDPYLVEALGSTADASPKLLHIGCGTSLLSFHLRAHVKCPEQIHNLDYSEVAVEIGRKREVEVFSGHPELGKELQGGGSQGDASHRSERIPVASTKRSESDASEAAQNADDPSYMHWSSADLLDCCSLLQACQPSSYSIIVDKSTCDSIACSEDVCVPLPYHIITSPSFAKSSEVTESPEPIHPLHVLAIHLALLAKPKARWIALSYSKDRFPFLHSPRHDSEDDGKSDDDWALQHDLDDIPTNIIENGFPDPGHLWKLIGKYPIEAPPESTPPNRQTGGTVVHVPKIMHYIYILERTDAELLVRG